jgi:hypothetical protein
MENTNSITFDIVNLIEKNPIARFNRNYQNKFINKIQEKFTETEQHLFVGSFYCYLNYNNNDFIIDLENVWKWLGFARKTNCKVVLEKHFKKDKDYIINNQEKSKNDTSATSGAKNNEETRGGYNKEIILLNVITFKKLCLKSNTKKADEIHDYFIKLEETLQEIINEESGELKLQLQTREQELQNQIINSQKEKDQLRERTILEHFPDNTQCVYYGFIDNITPTGESLIKFGNSNFLRDRIEVHRKTFTNFRLVSAFKVDNKIQIENELKNNPVLKMMQRTLTINGKNQTELLLNNLSTAEMDKLIQEIITNIEFNPENYKKILEDNDTLKKENESLKKENKVLKEVVKRYQSTEKETPKIKPNTTLIIDNQPSTIIEVPIVLTDKEFNYETNRLRRLTKEKDGLFHIGTKVYTQLMGTREEVWSEKAYKTAGNLTKLNLDIGRDGRVVSKSKKESSLIENRLAEYNNSRIKK